MEPIIVGVDPGTTSAYAILNTEGSLLGMESSRSLNLSSMISQVIGYGNPVIVGCDKNPAPSFVEKFATKVGAKLVYPREDLSVDEKKRLTDIETRNDHEMDAYASAVHALKDYKKLFRKVDEVLEREEKEYLADQLKYLVVKESMSIREGIEYLEEEPEEESDSEPVRVEVVRPTQEIEDMEKQIALLEQKNSELKEKLKELKRENERLKDRIEGMPVDEVVREKESTIRNLGDRLESREEAVREKENALVELKGFLARSSQKVLAKKMANLSEKEYEAKEWLRFSEGDVLLVDDPNVASEEVLKELKGRVHVMIHRKNLARRYEGFSFVKADNLDMDEREDFALVEKDELEEELSRGDVLHKVVLDYKKRRKPRL